MFSSPHCTAYRPYILLPEIEFTDDELRVILLHEWKHILDKDHLTGKIVEVICLLFWWNPLVYILARNFRFAQQLKCDQFAVSSKEELIHYVKGFKLVDSFRQKQRKQFQSNIESNALVNTHDETIDRLNVLILRSSSRSKRILANMCYCFVIFALFIASYMINILPAFWEASDVTVSTEIFMGEHSEVDDIFRAEENFVVDNGDGTFSLYVDGQFIKYMSGEGEHFSFLPVRERE